MEGRPLETALSLGEAAEGGVVFATMLPNLSASLRSLPSSCLTLVLSVVTWTSAALASCEEALIDLGTPISAVVIADAAYGLGPEGEPYLYVLVKGPPALFNVIDVRTSKRVFAQPLPNTKMSWGMAVGPDDAVYIATSMQGKMYRWKPGAAAVEDLGVMISGETHLWTIAIARDGTVYSGTYPGGRAFAYDPATGVVRDFGQIAEGAAYARAIAVSEQHLFVGTGARTGRIFQIDRKTGDKTEIPLPPDVHPTLIMNLAFREGLLFTSVKTQDGYLVYDTEAKNWSHHRLTLPSPAGPDGKLYSLSGSLYVFDPETGDWTSTGFRPRGGGARSYGWLALGDSDFPGQSLVSTDMRGGYWMYNPQTGKGKSLTADVQASPVPIRSIEAGPDGRVYIGGYLSPGAAAAYDPASGTLVRLPGMGQIEGWGAHGEELLIGVYPRAEIFRCDPREPWNYGKNPRKLFEIGQQQDRPFAFASNGRQVAIGTVPEAGQLGGALTVADLESGDRQTFRNVVQDQSIISLVFHEQSGLLAGGSSISCGLGIEPAAKEGTLFLWDIEAGEKIWSGTPVPGQMGVTGLTAGPSGILWGITGQFLFRFDPEQLRVIDVINLFPDETLSDPATEWVNGYLNLHSDGYWYGLARSRVFRLDPRSMKSEELIRHAAYFAQDENGDILFARNQRLLRLPYAVLSASRKRK